MRQSVTMRLDPDVLKAARLKAAGDNRTLTNYVETLMRRDLQPAAADPDLVVIAPADVRDFVPVTITGETEDERNRRADIVSAVLDASGR
ncbi:hypothetical protein [uncultured Rhodospira sp.]|uniref:hypothetical protein n=1 Tax=uncultured Rhodospira sp. TaxID=1936189 RepID=UPI002631DFE9|nr:hypothetical protein [uncultured Rhodospira sp.]